MKIPKKIAFILILIAIAFSTLSAKGIYDKMLAKAISNNDITKISLYLKKGANINSYRYTDLEYPKLETIKFMIKNGYDVSDKEETCILSQVLQSRNQKKDTYEVVKLLIDNGAKPTCKDKDEYYQRSVISYFMSYGARYASDSTIKAFELIVKNAKSLLSYQDPLYKAFDNGTDSRSKIIKILIRNGVDVNEKLPRDSRPLELAVRYRLLDIVKFLVQNGADINHVREGYSPVDSAHSSNYDEIELFLVENGAKYYKYKSLN